MSIELSDGIANAFAGELAIVTGTVGAPTWDAAEERGAVTAAAGAGLF
ncbi:hypothetical protein [Mycolicibacterium sp.]|nr:hypothetical protein [Mycolicibacterium sp.]